MMPRRKGCMGLYGMRRLQAYTGLVNTDTPPHTSVTWPAHGPR